MPGAIGHMKNQKAEPFAFVGLCINFLLEPDAIS